MAKRTCEWCGTFTEDGTAWHSDCLAEHEQDSLCTKVADARRRASGEPVTTRCYCDDCRGVA